MIRTNTFALIRLLPMSDRDKDVEILALRHQPAVLQRMAGKPAFTPNDRTLLAALLHHLPTQKLRQLHLLVRPDTILRWHRELLNQRHAATCAPRRRGRQRTVRSIRALVLRLARCLEPLVGLQEDPRGTHLSSFSWPSAVTTSLRPKQPPSGAR